MIDYNEINDFIIKVFNYYNGRINIINKAVLDINWCNLTGSIVGGYSKLPNIVIIHPMVTIRFCEGNEFDVKINLIETIIHELYHADQLINYRLYMCDSNYNNFIEASCELQTIIYMAGHTQEICNMVGIDFNIDKDIYNKMVNYYLSLGANYQRRYFHDHIFMCIDDMCELGKDSELYEFIKYTLENKNNMIIIINGNDIPVCVDGRLISIDEFNRIMINYNNAGLYLVGDYEFDGDENGLLVNINVKLSNIMCKKA